MLTEASLALYLLSVRDAGNRARRAAPSGDVERPPGPLVWLAAGSATASRSEVDGLIAALRAAGATASVLVTCAEDAGSTDGGASAAPGGPGPGRVIRDACPAENLQDLRAFLDRWKPDVVALIGGRIRPALIHQVHLRDIPLFHFGAEAPRLPSAVSGRIYRLLPGLMRASLRRFTRILSRGPDAARALLRAGVPPHDMEIAGALQDGPGPMPYAEAEREALVQLLGPRPVWLAVNVPREEEDLVLAAHEAALRRSHRLLLVLLPDEAERGPALAEGLRANAAFLAARRGADEYPDADISIYIADVEGELGLWFRLATLTFFGGTMSGSAPSPDVSGHPFAAASLGSAVLFGPQPPEAFRAAFNDLAEAQAARRVRSSAELAEAIGEFLAPDKAAAMALNAWQVISDRDATTERAARLLRDALPREATPAGPARSARARS